MVMGGVPAASRQPADQIPAHHWLLSGWDSHSWEPGPVWGCKGRCSGLSYQRSGRGDQRGCRGWQGGLRACERGRRVWSATGATSLNLHGRALMVYVLFTGAHHRPHTTTDNHVFRTTRRHSLSGQADQARPALICSVRAIEVSCQRWQRCFPLDHCQPAPDGSKCRKSQQGNAEGYTTPA